MTTSSAYFFVRCSSEGVTINLNEPHQQDIVKIQWLAASLGYIFSIVLDAPPRVIAVTPIHHNCRLADLALRSDL